jgi:hypothetical protein
MIRNLHFYWSQLLSNVCKKRRDPGAGQKESNMNSASVYFFLTIGFSRQTRIIRVLQRARELAHLKDLDRARELSKYNE